MAEPSSFDVIVIGSGPGGYTAAIRAAQLGKSVCVIERDAIGGVCLNVGCIPSKTLISQAAAFSSARALSSHGVTIDASGFDYSRVTAAARKAADTLSRGVAFLLRKNGVTVIKGTAVLLSGRAVRIDGSRDVSAKNIIVATGSRPRRLLPFDFDEQTVLSSTGALFLDKLPKRLLVLGAGAIGVEFAHTMNAFGVAVTLVEMLERVLPIEDDDAGEAVRRSFARRGIAVHTGTRAVSFTKGDDGATVTLEDAEKKQTAVTVDRILVAVGRTPNTDGLGLERCGVGIDRQFIQTGDFGETSVPGVYAIGDVVATPQLAHVAAKEGEVAAEHIAGRMPAAARLDLDAVPNAVYCEPQVASFGPTRKKAEARGVPCKVSTVYLQSSGKAVASSETEGFVKLVHDPEGKELLGAHLVGAHATELVHELLLAKTARLPLAAVADMIHAHPTIAESLMEAARLANNRAIQL